MKALKDVCKISKDGKSITSGLAGAFFVVRSTCSTSHIWPAVYSLTKHEGCVEFRAARVNDFDECRWSDSEIKEMFYGKCPNEEAWLVIPVGQDWHWYRVDCEIKFS